MNLPPRYNRAPLMFPRTLGEAFKGPEYGAAIEAPMPRSFLASRGFWIGGLVSLGLWSALFFALTR